MKRTLTFIGLLLVTIQACLAYDHVILRNGKEFDVKLHQITDERIIFSYIGDKTSTLEEIPSKDVYLIYIEKQGNIYMTPEGKRITGEPKRIDPKRNDVIYLTCGREIGADNIRITENDIHYSVKSKSTGFKGLIGKIETGEAIFAKTEVFMIRYRSGIVDIITPIDTPLKVETESTTTENQQPQYVVVFHAVVKGDTLEKLSAKYQVTPEKIIEWNDLPQRIKPTSPLTVGMQLMIYQPKK